MHPTKTLTGQLFVSVPEAAEILGVDPRTLRHAIARGEVPATSIHGAGRPRVLVPTEWLRAEARVAADAESA